VRLRALLGACALTVALVAASGGATLAQTAAATDRTFYLRNDGADCGGASHPFLADTAGAEDLRCGYDFGLPVGEVNEVTGTDASVTYTTQTAFDHALDATRDLNGRITVTPYVEEGSAGSGAGQIVLEVYGQAVTAAGAVVELGSSRVEAIATPVASRQAMLYGILIPDELNGLRLTQLSLRINVRGAHIQHGFSELSGASHVNLPIQPALPGSEPTPAPYPTP
jgi:hypothetical protein